MVLYDKDIHYFRLILTLVMGVTMQLALNTFFWTFFFMVGFVSSIQIVEDFGAGFVARWLHHRVEASTLIVIYVLLILVLINTMRLDGMVMNSISNAICNGTLIYISKRMQNKRAFRVLLLCCVLLFAIAWAPYWPALLANVLLMGSLIPLNNHQEWIKAKKGRHTLVLVVISTLFWCADRWLYGYSVQATIGIIIVFVGGILLAHLYDRLLDYRKDLLDQLQYNNHHDALTEVYNLSKFNIDFARYRKLAQSSSLLSYLIILDIDHFKRVNDTYGHPAGSQVLRTFAQDLLAYLNATPIPASLYRTGGEEFSIIVTGATSADQLKQLVSDYRERLAKLTIKTDAADIKITVSAGISPIRATDMTDDDVISRADMYLYEAKQAGRNTVIMHED